VVSDQEQDSDQELNKKTGNCFPAFAVLLL